MPVPALDGNHESRPESDLHCRGLCERGSELFYQALRVAYISIILGRRQALQQPFIYNVAQ